VQTGLSRLRISPPLLHSFAALQQLSLDTFVATQLADYLSRFASLQQSANAVLPEVTQRPDRHAQGDSHAYLEVTHYNASNVG
jgi:hypothetical protein